ncbi:axonemal dynein light chain domain-containing protein 1 [Pelodytes ibericus]
MSKAEFPSPPAVPKPTGRRVVGGPKLLLLIFTELSKVQDSFSTMEKSQSGALHLQSDYIPDEIVQVLTSNAHPVERPDHVSVKKTPKNAKVCLRSTDQVWHHPFRRHRFKHLTDQPICLTGAGRDISFLCDVLLMQKNKDGKSSQREISTGVSIEDSLLPKDFYVVKNKGVLGLEYYEDKYTTLLEDDEKKLRVFPSMKPSGRLEVIQLMKVMDTMLKEAGVDEENLGMDGPTQIHNLLELLKTEQNIYNIVFHEIIRQVSVECAERGELLAKLRQRYVMLLNKVPHQVLSLYNDLLAQRALDRCLTEEIIHFKNSIGELTNELCQVREHDLRVSKDAKRGQAELAKALKDAKKNANLLEEYRELYELQRGRLEKHLIHLTEERDLWSSATYRLARKVIEENQLNLCRRLYLSEKKWTKVIRHFIVLLASNDTADLCKIQETTETWRKHMAYFDQELQRNEETTREKLRLIRSDLEKWRSYFQEKVFVDWQYHEIPEDVMETLSQDLKNWENMMNEELQQFEGNRILNNQETLKTAVNIQMQWVELGQKLLQRHQTIDGDEAPEKKAMDEVNNRIEELCEQYRRRIEGDNGLARALMTFCGSLGNWSLQLCALKVSPNGIGESDWLLIYHQLPDWLTLADQALELIGSAALEKETTTDSDNKLLMEDVFKMLQQWVLATTSGTEKDDVLLTQEVTNLHTSMVQYMVNTLILLTPNYPSESRSVTEFEQEKPSEVTAQNLHEDSLALSERVNCFSCFIIKCCKEMVERMSVEKRALLSDDLDHDLKQLETIKNSCNEWIETCQLLNAHITASSARSMTSLILKVTSDSEVFDIQPTSISDLHDDTTQDISKETPLEENIIPITDNVWVDPTITEDLLDGVRYQNDFPKESLSEEEIKHTTQDDKIQIETIKNKMASQQEVMRMIGHDGNIQKRSLIGEEIAISLEGALTANRPGTPRCKEAFDSLISLDQMQKRLLLAETRAQEAEERSECLDEQLKEALQRIQELEKLHHRDESSSRHPEDVASQDQSEEQKISPVTQAKKRPKSNKMKKQN